MRTSDLKPGQRFKLATDPRTLTALDCDPAFSGDAVYGVDEQHNLVGCHPDAYCELVGDDVPRSALAFTIERDGKQLTGKVQVLSGGVEVHFDGYGVHDTEPGYGAPVFIEPGDDGHPIALIWAEIDCQDFTHSVSLRHARESLVV